MGVDYGVFWRHLGVDIDSMTGVSSVGTWDLEALKAVRAGNEQGLTFSKLVEVLEEVNPPQGDFLRRPTVITSENDSLEPGEHDVIRCPRQDGWGLSVSLRLRSTAQS